MRVLAVVAAGAVLLSGAIAAQQAASTSTKAKATKATAKASKSKAKPKAAPEPLEALPQPTEAEPVVQIPLRPSQMPAVPPRINFLNGKLTVVAENTALTDIFHGIRNATGTNIEMVGGPSGERVAAKIGPAAVREVLLSLLQGSRYDYVILGSERDPSRVERVILTPKSAGGGTETAAATPLRQPQPQEDEFYEVPAETPGDRSDDDPEGFVPANIPAQPGEAVPGQPQPGQALPGNPLPGQPGQQDSTISPGDIPSSAPPGQPQPASGQQPKTPEQLLEDLRRLEQERQQQGVQPVPQQETRPKREPR
jgi:hypothetical protein